MFECLSCEQLKSMKDDAISSLHRLRTGQSVRVVVDQNGERVEFSAANQAGLITYIQQLDDALRLNGCLDGKCAVSRPRNRPLSFLF